ncbi:hypothetical protein ZIOFF_075772 [Zingiber officinale]|uniref:Endonuclease/exonuclease/phosphatase domain-containing protein n=1 Tax=Zingiber officinale TaxID=94328 RepID=A0A8J5BTD9_ZINOF|nr:hypothetical protein ZIOFF_075772 [Zingiber officinale]
MARIVGCPIKIDEATADGSRLFMARACVEIDLLKPRVEQHLGHAEADCYVAGNKPRHEWHRDRVDPIPPGADLRERLNQRKRDRRGKAVVVDSEAQDFQRVGGRRAGQTWARKQLHFRMGQETAQELHTQVNSFEVLKDTGEKEEAGDDVMEVIDGREALGDTPQLGTETDDGVGEEEDRVAETQLVEEEDRMPGHLGQHQTLRQTSQGLGQQDSVSVEGGEQQVGDQTSQNLGQGEQVSQTVQRPGIGAQQRNTDGAQGQGGASRGLQDASLISGEEPRVLESSGELPEDDCLDSYSSSSADQGVSDDLGQKVPARPTQDIPEGSEAAEYMARRMGFEEVVSNKSGKVWFFWESTIACKVLFDHDQFLHLELSSQLFPSSMIVTVVYAKCTRLERSVLWESLEELRPEGDRLWLVGGDFNVISSMEENSAGVLTRPGAMEDFNNFIMLAGLVDAGFVGDRYTWTNNRVWKRLDRVLLSPSWSSLDFTVRVEHLSRAASDHCPLLPEAEGLL